MEASPLPANFRIFIDAATLKVCSDAFQANLAPTISASL